MYPGDLLQVGESREPGVRFDSKQQEQECKHHAGEGDRREIKSWFWQVLCDAAGFSCLFTLAPLYDAVANGHAVELDCVLLAVDQDEGIVWEGGGCQSEVVKWNGLILLRNHVKGLYACGSNGEKCGVGGLWGYVERCRVTGSGYNVNHKGARQRVLPLENKRSVHGLQFFDAIKNLYVINLQLKGEALLEALGTWGIPPPR